MKTKRHFSSLRTSALCLLALAVSTGASAMTGLFPQPWKFDRKYSEFNRLPRHERARTSGIPAPYAAMRNPLPLTRATLVKGAAVYARHCLSCHGRDGEGDGPAGFRMSPRPGDLAWLAEMKVSRSDGFMYWTIAEGGAPVGSAMPAYAGLLTPEEIWAVTTHIQIRLPRTARPI